MNKNACLGHVQLRTWQIHINMTWGNWLSTSPIRLYLTVIRIVSVRHDSPLMITFGTLGDLSSYSCLLIFGVLHHCNSAIILIQFKFDYTVSNVCQYILRYPILYYYCCQDILNCYEYPFKRKKMRIFWKYCQCLVGFSWHICHPTEASHESSHPSYSNHLHHVKFFELTYVMHFII